MVGQGGFKFLGIFLNFCSSTFSTLNKYHFSDLDIKCFSHFFLLSA